MLLCKATVLAGFDSERFICLDVPVWVEITVSLSLLECHHVTTSVVRLRGDGSMCLHGFNAVICLQKDALKMQIKGHAGFKLCGGLQSRAVHQPALILQTLSALFITYY